MLAESGGERLLVDCGPDIRSQLLDAGIANLDHVIVTHDHADHCHGIDELRPIAQARGRPLPIHAREAVLVRLNRRFDYAFVGSGFYAPVVEPVVAGEELKIGEMTVRFVDQPHGDTMSLGVRVDEGTRSAVYAIDFNAMSHDMKELYEGADVMICDCLQRRPHPTHAHLDAVLQWARDLRVGQLYLTHMSNVMDYGSLVRELPDWAAPAHDGLEISL